MDFERPLKQGPGLIEEQRIHLVFFVGILDGLETTRNRVLENAFLENAFLEKVVGAGVVRSAAPVTQEPTENPREPPVAACRRIEEPRSDGGVR